MLILSSFVLEQKFKNPDLTFPLKEAVYSGYI